MYYQFTLTILDISRMNFPSLYFCVSSYALSYFHPNTSWQSKQCTSATVWSPVMSCLFSFCPVTMFIACENKNARPCFPWQKTIKLIHQKPRTGEDPCFTSQGVVCLVGRNSSKHIDFQVKLRTTVIFQKIQWILHIIPRNVHSCIPNAPWIDHLI